MFTDVASYSHVAVKEEKNAGKNRMMLNELEVMEGQETETWVVDPKLDWLGSWTSPIP